MGKDSSWWSSMCCRCCCEEQPPSARDRRPLSYQQLLVLPGCCGWSASSSLPDNATQRNTTQRNIPKVTRLTPMLCRKRESVEGDITALFWRCRVQCTSTLG